MGVKVSVVVPVYNTEQYLRRCLDSLVQQTLEEIEVIVVNDGSPDNSKYIIDEYKNRYPKILALTKENGGLGDARNYGIEYATGEYVAFVDSDDYVEANMYEVMYRKAIQEELDIVVCDTYMDYPTHSYVLKADMGYADSVVKSYIFAYPNAPARLVKTELMKKNLFRNDIWYEDLNLMPRLVINTQKIGFINQALYHYIQHDNSIMNQMTFSQKFEDIFVALQDVCDAYQEYDIYNEYYEELEYLHVIHLQRSAVLRFVGVKGAEMCLKKINLIMKKQFPNWKHNIYLKKSGWKIRLICLLASRKQYWAISIIKKIV